MRFLKTLNVEKRYILADQVVVSGAAFATNLLLARALGLANYGRFASVGMVQLFVLSLSMGGIVQIYQVVFPSLSTAAKKLYTNGVFWWQVTLLSLLLLITFMVCLWAPQWLAAYQQIALAGAVATALFLLQDFIRKALLTAEKSREAFWCDVLTNGLQLIGMGLAWWLHLLTVATGWWIIGITFIPSLALGILFLQPGWPQAAAMQVAWAKHRPKAGWLLLSALLQWCSGYFFVIAAGLWLGATALGALRLIQYIFGLLNVALQAIENYALPKAAGMSGNLDTYLQKLLQKSLLLMLPVLVLLSLFARPVLLLAGGVQYTDYVFVFYGLSVVYVLITIGGPVRIAVRSLHLEKHYFRGYILSFLFSISAAPWLLKTWQLQGVLAGLVATQIITLGYWCLVLHQKNIRVWKSYI